MCTKSARFRIAYLSYLFEVCNLYILAKRARTEVLEDREGSARNELRESIGLKWLHSGP